MHTKTIFHQKSQWFFLLAMWAVFFIAIIAFPVKSAYAVNCDSDVSGCSGDACMSIRDACMWYGSMNGVCPTPHDTFGYDCNLCIPGGCQ